ncbi:MAG: nicotinate (nicotinamide) nucleotide adenylyltransferase [Planctomycetota bacterium]|jgi:nicotinate-nucleotide adenylyltransferase
MPPPPLLIFGGTFDPPHVAHTALPPLVARRLGCARILYVPAALNPLKTGLVAAPAEHRLAMLRLALDRVPDAEISRLELDRPGPSYTVDTLEALHAQVEPGTELHLLIGSDQALTFEKWKRWQRILELATPVVMVRPPLDEESYRRRLQETYSAEQARRWLDWTAAVPYMDIDATGLRQRLAEGSDVRGMLPPAVLAYIRENGLYGAAPA